MTYTVVPTVYTNDLWTAANQNTYLKDNMAHVEAQGEGENTWFFNAAALVAQAGADPGLLTRVDFGTLCHLAIPFDKDIDEFLNFILGMPKRYDKGSVHIKFAWCTNGGTATSGNVVLSAAINALDSGDTLGSDPVAGVANVSDAWSADNKIEVTSWVEVTPNNSPSDDNVALEFQFGRDADNGSDTLDDDALLIGLWFRWTSNVEMDD